MPCHCKLYWKIPAGADWKAGTAAQPDDGRGGLFKEMERKIEKLKDEMALTIKKIEAIDENLE